MKIRYNRSSLLSRHSFYLTIFLFSQRAFYSFFRVIILRQKWRIYKYKVGRKGEPQMRNRRLFLFIWLKVILSRRRNNASIDSRRECFPLHSLNIYLFFHLGRCHFSRRRFRSKSSLFHSICISFAKSPSSYFFCLSLLYICSKQFFFLYAFIHFFPYHCQWILLLYFFSIRNWTREYRKSKQRMRFFY